MSISHRYDLELDRVAELWRRGSVIGSWLLDLIAEALRQDPQLERFSERVPIQGKNAGRC